MEVERERGGKLKHQTDGGVDREIERGEISGEGGLRVGVHVPAYRHIPP